MRSGVDFEHLIPLSARSGPKETGPLDAGGVWRSIWSVEGWWSNVDIYLDVPASWAAALTDVSVRLFAVTSAGRSIVAETTISASGMELLPDGTRSGIVLAGRGHPGSGWIVEASNPSLLTGVLSASVTAEVWGTESTPEGIGRRPSSGLLDRSIPSRASHLMGWPGAIVPPPAGSWIPVAVDPATGHLIVDTAILPAAVGEQSRFQNISTLNDAAVKASAGRVFSAMVENVSGPQKFFQLHAKLGALAPGDVPFIVAAVPANSTVILGNDFFGSLLAASPLLGGLAFATGIRWGWSTTRGTYTAAPVATQTTQILFA